MIIGFQFLIPTLSRFISHQETFLRYSFGLSAKAHIQYSLRMLFKSFSAYSFIAPLSLKEAFHIHETLLTNSSMMSLSLGIALSNVVIFSVCM